MLCCYIFEMPYETIVCYYFLAPLFLRLQEQALRFPPYHNPCSPVFSVISASFAVFPDQKIVVSHRDFLVSWVYGETSEAADARSPLDLVRIGRVTFM